jgi:Xaa-Pro aminopeptidase
MADMSRCKFRIKPESKVSQIYETLYDANEEIRKSIRPGLKCSDIARMAQSTFDAAGLKPFIKDVFGHGIGVSLHEPPYVSLHDQTVLEPGMVLTVELGTFVPKPGLFI